MNEHYRKLYDSTEIKQSIGRMASDITAKYNGDDPKFGSDPLFIGLMRGAVPFASRLMFEITRQAPGFNPKIDWMTTSRYADSITPNAEMEIVKDLTPGIRIVDRPVVIVDDVFDMGITAETVRRHVLNMGARFVELAVLVEKKVERRPTIIRPDYIGFRDAPNGWLVGMGMDDTDEAYRWADDILIIEPEENQNQHAIVKA